MTTTPTASDIARLMQELADAGAEADPGAFDRLLSDDITWRLMGQGLDYARTYRGKAELYAEYMGKLQARLDRSRSRTSTVDVMADDGRGLVAVHNCDDFTLVDGRPLAVDVLLLMRVKEGKVVEVREFMDLRPVEAAFGSSLD